MDKAASSALRASRNGAGEGCFAADSGRHKQANPGRASAATCNRRNARASMPASGQASTPAKPPLASNCSQHQAPCRPARITTRRSRATPAAAQAGAWGKAGGVTKASQPPSAESRANAGSNKVSSPRPLRSTRISVRFPRGQPPPGNSASRAGCPLGTALAGSAASESPRQTSPRARTAARPTGNGVFMKVC